MNKKELIQDAWDERPAEFVRDGVPQYNPSFDCIAGFNAAFNIFSLTKAYHRDILIYAFRYTLGRTSYSTSIMQDAITDIWPELTEHDRKRIKREIVEYKERAGTVGMDCDDSGWMKLLEMED